MINKSTLILICLLNASVSAWSQDRYVVFFTDKAGSAFSIDKPAAFLSQRAIERRQRQGISIKEQDLPVQESYISALTNLGVTCFYRSRWMNGVLVQMEKRLLPGVQKLRFVRNVEYVAPGVMSTPGRGGVSISFGTPAKNDFQNQMLGIDRMHADGYRGKGVLIGVFDGGFRKVSKLPVFNHLFADRRILYTFDYTANEENVENTVFDHGTKVLSVLAADKPGQFTGTAPQASYILATTEEGTSEYRIEEYNWLFAAEKADSAGVDIINTSLGYSVFNDARMNYTKSEMDGKTTVISRAVNRAFERGILLLTSAGNTGRNPNWDTILAPADSPNTLAIGAVNLTSDRTLFSSKGPTADGRVKPDLMALGFGTVVMGATGTFTFASGSSFSSPLVTGLAAGLWQAYPELTAAQLLDVLRRSGDNYQNPDNELGYGIPGYVKALKLADEISPPLITPNLVAYPNPIVNNTVNLAFGSRFFGQPVIVKVYNARGIKLKTRKLNPTARNRRIRLYLGEIPAGIYLLKITGAGGTLVKSIVDSR